MEMFTKGIAMKVLQYLVSVVFVLAGIALLLGEPVHAQTKAFAPTRFTVVDQGKAGAPDVVLIPGLASGRGTYAAEAKLLAPNYRLHLVQVNGFAGQAAGPNATGEILPGIVDELHQYIAGAGMKPVVVGHSLGGLLALMLAEKYPADARKLVIVDALPFYALMFAPEATAESAKPIAQAMKEQLASVPQDQYEASWPMLAAQMTHDAAGQKAIVADVAATDRAVIAEAMMEDLETDVRAGLPNIKVPVLVMYEHDATMPQPNADTYEKTMKDSYVTLPNAELTKFEGSRHFIMYDKPVEFDAVLEKFLK
jgi:pimeloyl-ACP methyl ester carboxylesterase